MDKIKTPKLVTVAILTTITIIFWVFVGLYNIIVTPSPVNIDPELLEPINPVLDKEALKRLEGRIFFDEGETRSPFILSEMPSLQEEKEISKTEQAENPE